MMIIFQHLINKLGEKQEGGKVIKQLEENEGSVVRK